MTKIRIDHRLSPREYAAVMDAAKLRAMQLRGEALDEAWMALGRGVRAVWRVVRKGQSHTRATRHQLKPGRGM